MEWYWYLIIVLASLIVLITLIAFIVGYIFFRAAIPTNAKPSVPKYDVSEEKTKEMNAFFKEEKERLKSMNMEEVYVRSFDGLKLHAYLKEAPNKTDKTIICVHGYDGTALSTAPKFSYFLIEYNYNVLFIDLRGYGKSEGKYSTYGVFEREDVRTWMNYVIDRYGDKSSICLFGMSMGGNSVLTLSDEVPPQVKCIINDSGFTSTYDEFVYMVTTLKKAPKFIVDCGRIVTKMIAKFDIKDEISDARIHLSKSKVPVLFLHSDVDNFVPPYMGKENYDACKSLKEVYIFKGCPHVRNLYFYKEEYRSCCLNFLARYL